MSEDTTIVKRFINNVQNHRILAIILIVCSVIIGVASLTDSIDKILTFTKKYFFVPSTRKLTSPTSGSQIGTSPATANKFIEGGTETELTKEASLTSKTSQRILSNGKPSNAKRTPIEKNPQVAEDEQRPVLLNTRSSAAKESSTDVVREPQKESQNRGLSPAIDNSRPIPSDKDAVEIRPSVKVAMVSLQDETLSSRVRSIGVLLPSLPDDLNAREMALLAGSETLSYRQNILELLVKRAKLRSLRPADVPLLIGSETLSRRVNCINIIVPFIKGPITGKQVIAILSSETLSYRVECLRAIAHLVLQPLSESDVQGILEGTSFSYRTQAIKLIFSEKN